MNPSANTPAPRRPAATAAARCLLRLLQTGLLVGLLLLAVRPLPMAAAGKFVLVIDAGHGGKDSGCPGAYSCEKNLTLKYALAFGKMVERNCPDVKVLYTRTTDRFVELKQRAQFANDNKADLFVSVHINAVDGSKAPHGYQTYTLGRGETTGKAGIKENFEVAKRENSVIYMEKDYKQNYQGFDPNSPESNIMFELMQDVNMERSVALAKMLQTYICEATGRLNKGAHQNNLAVLRLTSMPGCLMELGFISNPEEENFLNAVASTDKYARGFLKAFISYKNKYFDGLKVPYRPSDVKDTQVAPIVPDEYKKDTPAAPAKPAATPEQPRAGQKRQEPATKGTAQPTPAPAETAQNTAAPTAKNQPQPTPATAPADAHAPATAAEPIFKVQILTGRALLKPDDRQFKGVSGVESYEENGTYKYTVGASADYNAIARLRKELLEKFPEAFIVAFRNGEKINVNEAIAEFKRNKKPA